MNGMKLGLLYTVALAVILWLVFFKLKPTDDLPEIPRPVDTELTGILFPAKTPADSGFVANFAVLNLIDSTELIQCTRRQIPVRGVLEIIPAEWEPKSPVFKNFPEIQVRGRGNWPADLSRLNQFLTASQTNFILTLDAMTPLKAIHLSGWHGFAARLSESDFVETFLAASRAKNLVRGRNLPVWFEMLTRDDPTSFQNRFVAAFMQHEITGFQLEWPETPVPGQFLVNLNILQQLNFIADFDFVWQSGTREIGVLLAETYFDSGSVASNCAKLTARCLLRAGIPVEIVPLERAYLTGYLAPYRILFLNYQDQLPGSPVFHDVLAGWVRTGGVLIFHPGPAPSGEFWWQPQFASPAAHLYQALKLQNPDPKVIHQFGKGAVIISADSLRTAPEISQKIREQVRQAVSDINQEYFEYHEQNYLYLKRGPFVAVAVFENSVSDRQLEIPGSFIDCGSAELPLTDKKILPPGEVALLYNLKKVTQLTGKVLLSASKIFAEKHENRDLSFNSLGPSGTRCQTLVKLGAMPPGIELTTANGLPVPFEMQWMPEERLLRLIYPNQGKVVHVRLFW